MWEIITNINDDIIRFSMCKDINLIFTLVWDFNNTNIMEYMKQLERDFNSYNKEIDFLELDCDINERLKRNITGDRFKSKPPKRDIVASEISLRREWDNSRIHSLDGIN